MTAQAVRDQAAHKVHDYLMLVMNVDDPRFLLSEEDALAASTRAEVVFLRHTQLDAGQARNAALDVAFDVQQQLRKEYA